MTEKGPKIGDLGLNGRYELLQQVKGMLGGKRTYVGTKGACRYCGESNPSRFRNVAHTFPEGLGNKWIFSLDECDGCNRKFSLYDDALTNSVSPFLTLGGTKGKDNKIRQTGRTKDRSIIRRREGGERPQISVILKDADAKDHIFLNPATGKLTMKFPVPDVRFRPRHAYKGLAKMGFALLPDDELANYQRLRAWLRDVSDKEDFPFLEAGMSFGSVGNAPVMACGSILRRVDPTDEGPYILFIFCAGSVCLQIELMPDSLDDQRPLVEFGTLRVKWQSVLRDGRIIPYSEPIHLDWSSGQITQLPIESLVLDFDQRTLAGSFTPIFRRDQRGASV